MNYCSSIDWKLLKLEENKKISCTVINMYLQSIYCSRSCSCFSSWVTKPLHSWISAIANSAWSFTTCKGFYYLFNLFFMPLLIPTSEDQLQDTQLKVQQLKQYHWQNLSRFYSWMNEEQHWFALSNTWAWFSALASFWNR